jgi:cytochrome c-type biogenesis protein CcmF
MIEIGSYALYLALFFAVYAIVAGWVGARRDRPDLVRSAERAVYGVFALFTLAMLGVESALLGGRYDLAFVAQNSSREQAWIYKATALWGGQAGSLLLWGWILTLFSALVVWSNRQRNRTLMPWVIVTLMANVVFFAVLICFISDPFAPLPVNQVISNGRGLNPLLQHPAMVIHPPVLYLGFVGFAVPFAFALAALITGELGVNWFRTTRRWTLAAWFFLGCGIMLGGRWAYEVLGWGGYWGWDPVENASFMPFLAGTAYLHSVMIQEKRGMLKIWNLALIGLTYGLCAVVLFGTLYPVISEALQGTRVQIGPPFFQRYAGPLALALLVLTGIGPLIAWRRATWVNLRKSFLWPAASAGLLAAALLAFGVRDFYPVAFVVLSGFVVGTIVEEYYRGIRARMRRGEGPLRAFAELVQRNQRRYAGYIVHLSVVLMFVGFAGAAFNLEETRLLRPGDRWELGGYTLEYRQARPVDHLHYAGVRARVAVYTNGTPLGILTPEKRMYFQQEQPTTIPAVASSLKEDLYVIIAGLEPDASAAFKVYINPLVNWLWIGGYLFVAGNLLLLWPLPERRSGRAG